MSTEERKRRQPRARPPMPERDVTEPHPYAYLSDWRVQRGLTLDDVSAALKVSAPTVHRWETGDTPITVKTWFLLADLYKAEHPMHLFLPADQSAKSAALKSAYDVLKAMSPEDRDHWIALGRRIADLTPDQAPVEDFKPKSLYEERRRKHDAAEARVAQYSAATATRDGY